MAHNASPRVGELAERLRAAGVVGAGGAGYSVADKLLARPYRTLIINAAQSEPLCSKDWAVLENYAQCVFAGTQLLREAFDLAKVFLAVREEFAALLPDLAAQARRHGVALARLPDHYPLGYEKILRREVLGLPFGAPEAELALVINAETLRNVSWAANLGRTLTHKLVTLAGAVTRPLTLEVPIGTPFADCLAHAGGASEAHYALFEDGVLGGRRVDTQTAAVRATTLCYVLLPLGHSAVAETTGAADAALAQRRRSFFDGTLAGRTQPMSAAYALFDLARYRRSRPGFRALKADAEQPQRVRITPCGRDQRLAPCVAAGQRVERGAPIASSGEAGRAITRHASVAGVVESADAEAIVIRRAAPESAEFAQSTRPRR